MLMHKRRWDPDLAPMAPIRWRIARLVQVMPDPFAEQWSTRAIDDMFATMALAPQHTFQLATVRPDVMRTWFSIGMDGDDDGRDYTWGRVSDACIRLRPEELDNAKRKYGHAWPLPNVWLGAILDDLATSDARIIDLLACPAAIHFVRYKTVGPLPLPTQAAWAQSLMTHSRASGVAIVVEQKDRIGDL